MCFALVPLRENSEDAGIAASSLIWALLPATFVIFFAIQQIEIAVAAIGVMVCLVIGYFTLEPFGNTGEKD